MRILITGGCGFVGANLVARLSGQKDVTLRVFDNESLGKREHLGGLACDFVRGDLRDRAALDQALVDMDAVVHLAADTRVIDSIANPVFNLDVNVIGTVNLLEAMRARGIKRLVSASTGGAIIGKAEGPVHEKMVPSPLSPYGASKLAVEGYCSAYSECYGLRALSLRFSNVYGPRSFHKGSVVAAFFKRIIKGMPLPVYGDGTQTRDFIFADDLCDGIINGLRSDAIGAVQLGSGTPLSVNELLDAIRTVVAPQPIEVEYLEFRAGEIHTTYCDIAKARMQLGFAPQTSLLSGLRTTWSWFLAQAGQKAMAPAQL
jgi:UDP-glucose 4-epimerase